MVFCNFPLKSLKASIKVVLFGRITRCVNWGWHELEMRVFAKKLRASPCEAPYLCFVSFHDHKDSIFHFITLGVQKWKLKNTFDDRKIVNADKMEKNSTESLTTVWNWFLLPRATNHRLFLWRWSSKWHFVNTSKNKLMRIKTKQRTCMVANSFLKCCKYTWKKWPMVSLSRS